MNDWHEKVYHTKDKDLVPENWDEIRKQVIKRDGKCYRCETKQRRHLTVHHIIPRLEGGKENKTNLITLCTRCHDIVEVAHCRSLMDIDNTLEEDEAARAIETTAIQVQDRDETFPRPEWHKWVYGGQRRPT